MVVHAGLPRAAGFHPACQGAVAPPCTEYLWPVPLHRQVVASVAPPSPLLSQAVPQALFPWRRWRLWQNLQL